VYRALIDWDFAADGIWIVRSPRDFAAVPAKDQRSHGNEFPEPTRHFRELLSHSLMERLKRWNERGCSLGGPNGNKFDDKDWESFYRDGRSLAEAAQSELGEQWRVLWAANGAWHFVRFP